MNSSRKFRISYYYRCKLYFWNNISICFYWPELYAPLVPFYPSQPMPNIVHQICNNFLELCDHQIYIIKVTHQFTYTPPPTHLLGKQVQSVAGNKVFAVFSIAYAYSNMTILKGNMSRLLLSGKLYVPIGSGWGIEDVYLHILYLRIKLYTYRK